MTNFYSKITFLLIIFPLLLSAHAQNAEFDSLLNKGISQIYNIKFDEAQETFNYVESKYPKHPAGKFFKAMIIWWKITLNQENEEFDELFEDELEDVIDFCDELLDEDDENVDALFFKGGALGFRGRLYALRKDWFDAALDGKDALPLVYEAFNIDSTNEDVKLGFGIYNYYAAAIPEKYPFIKPAMIFFPSGDKEKGIEQLKIAAEKAKYASVEAMYFLMNLYYQFENNFTEAFNYGEELHNSFPDNPVFHKYLGRIFIKKGNYKKASFFFSDIKQKCENNLPGYNEHLLRESSYYLGVNFMQQNQIDSAMICFEKCEEVSLKIDNDEESGFRINATLYLGKIADQTGNLEKAEKYYEKVIDMREYNNSHKKAERYLAKLNEKKKAGR